MSERLVASVDLGGTKVRALVADGNGHVLAREEELTARHGGEDVVDQIIGLVKSVSSRAGRSHIDLADLVIGVPGVIRSDGHGVDEQWVFNIAGFGDLDLVQMVRADLDVRVILENDLNLAAWGEWTVGAGRNTDPFAFVGLGTGIGMGLVIAGKLVRGAHRHAGELAHLPLEVRPKQLAVPSPQAWLELQVSQEALLTSAFGRDRGPDSEDLTSAADIYRAAANGHERSIVAVRKQAMAVAKALATVSLIVDPQLVVLGGGMGLQESLAAMIRSQLTVLQPNPPRIATSSLRDDAGLIGGVQYALALKGAPK